MNAEAKAILEAALLCAQHPLTVKDMLSLLGADAHREGLAALLAELQAEWQARGSLRLVETAAGWRFQTHGAVREALAQLHPERPRRYSRAAMETLAVIAYRQPVTRGDIEDIRGVVVSSDIIKQFEERGWIESIGHRDAPGRPQLYATTKAFLDDLGLKSLSELPPLDDMGDAPALPTELPLQASLLDLVDGAEADADPGPTEGAVAEIEVPTESTESLIDPELPPAEAQVPTNPADADAQVLATSPDEGLELPPPEEASTP